MLGLGRQMQQENRAACKTASPPKVESEEHFQRRKRQVKAWSGHTTHDIAERRETAHRRVEVREGRGARR